MKKGFTMIELIFVIVILGILASVAIPRLAATKEDAEISATVANLRTLVSDASAYYTAKGEFPSNVKWNEITNVPLATTNTNSSSSSTTTAAAGNNATAHLKVGGQNCIGVHLVNKDGAKPAHIKFTKGSPSGVCDQIQKSAPVKAYIESKVPDGGNGISDAIAIGSSTSVYPPAPKPTT